jgi:hypothetical protein
VSKKSEIEAEKAEALASLRKMLKPGQTVYTVLRKRSASGMSRVIDLVIAYRQQELIYPKLPDGRTDWDATPTKKLGAPQIRSIGFLASKAGVGERWDSDWQGIRIGGCGMDMGFELVYRLGYRMWPNGTPKPHSNRNGKPDNDGGYALKHSWL